MLEAEVAASYSCPFHPLCPLTGFRTTPALPEPPDAGATALTPLLFLSSASGHTSPPFRAQGACGAQRAELLIRRPEAAGPPVPLEQGGPRPGRSASAFGADTPVSGLFGVKPVLPARRHGQQWQKGTRVPRAPPAEGATWPAAQGTCMAQLSHGTRFPTEQCIFPSTAYVQAKQKTS